MKCVIPELGIRAFGKAVHCLAKIGEEIFLETRTNGLSFKTVNSARSAYVCFEFNKTFFDSFKSELSNSRNDEDTVYCCKIITKSLLLIFRALSSLEKTVQKCHMCIDTDSSKMIFVFHCKHGIIKRHSIGYNECETLKAVYSKENCSNQLGGAARPLSDVVINFPNSLDEVTLIARRDRILLKNYTEDIQDSRIPLTEVCLFADEFDSYFVTDETSVTFCLKELRAILGFADSVGDNLSISFDTCGQPVILSIVDNSQYSADIVLASLMEDRQENTAAHEVTATSSQAMADSSIRREEMSVRHSTLQSSRLKASNRQKSIQSQPEQSDIDSGWISGPVSRDTSFDQTVNDQPHPSQMHTAGKGSANGNPYRPKGLPDRSLTDPEFFSGFPHQDKFTRKQLTVATVSPTIEEMEGSDLSGILPCTPPPPPTKKFKSLFSIHDMFGGEQITDSILAPDSEEEED